MVVIGLVISQTYLYLKWRIVVENFGVVLAVIYYKSENTRLFGKTRPE